VVICHEQIRNRKPHPEGLETSNAIDELFARRVVLYRRHSEDIEMGKRAGLLTVGVRSTYPTNWKLKSSSPDIYIQSLTELSELF